MSDADLWSMIAALLALSVLMLICFDMDDCG